MLMSFVEMKDSIGMAFGSLRANKFRSGLTILGVMIGVSSVIAMASIINGLNGQMNNEIDEMGSNVIWITKFAPDVDHEDIDEEDRNRPPITVSEANAILLNCPTVEGVSPQNYYFKPSGNDVKYKNRKYSRPRLMGTWPDFLKVNNRNLTAGRFITESDEQFRTMVVVIGADVADVLFESDAPVGKQIRVNNNVFEVIGVLEKVKSSFGNDEVNETVIMPLSTFEKIHPWEEELFLVARAKSLAQMEQAQEEIINALRVHRKVPFNQDNNFHLSTQQQFKDFIAGITKYIYLAMIIITSVGLMVGGIGVMNIMLVSVTERTREIGVRKAIGAKRANIILQFLTEAMTLSATGGLVGIVFGVLVGIGANAAFNFPLSVSVFWIVLGFVVAVSVGLVSGMYPAIKAARLDPIEALRYE
ncbi:MAG: ABC transporter permease [bacterium]|nr:ABC transporter permease [bacterium]